LPCPPVDGGPDRYARWGEQLDVRNITREGGDQVGELSAEQVAVYIAKYATASKATESFGSGLDRRLHDGDLKHLDKLPAHVGELVLACWELGGRPELERLRLRVWAHMLGFRGHWSTKSRRYSTTFTALRRTRVAFAKRRRAFERRIAYRKVGRFVRYHPDDLAEYIAAHRIEVARPADQLRAISGGRR
jgi:hypothetical protein